MTTPNDPKLAVTRGLAACGLMLFPLLAAAATPREPGEHDRRAPADAIADVRAAHSLARHSARVVQGGYEARNPGQRWDLQFDGRGFSARPDHGLWSWGLELASYGFAGGRQLHAEPARVCADGSRVTNVWDDVLEEWYLNDRRGLEHGFTLLRRPTTPAKTRGEGPLTLELAVRGGLRLQVDADGRGARFLDERGAVAVSYAGLVAFDADGRDLKAWLAPGGAGLVLGVDEREARYPITIDPIAQEAYIKASNPDPDDFFGVSVAISGDTAVVAAFDEDSAANGVDGNQADNSLPDSGAVYVFVRSGSSWTQQVYIKASNPDAGDEFGGNIVDGGVSVAISGDTLVVGAWREASSASGVDGNQADNSLIISGAAYVFVRNGTTWSQQAYLKASNPDVGDSFGVGVAVSGDTIAVSASKEGSSAVGVGGDESDNSAPNAGAVYVFVRNGTTWSQQAYVKASNTEAGDAFGAAVALDGDTLLVGARFEDGGSPGVDGDQSSNSAFSAGAAYVFVRNGTTWSQQAYLKAFNSPQPSDRFGHAVALQGDTAAIGAYTGGANNAGRAFVFGRSGTTWSTEAALIAPNPSPDTRFGWSVAVSDNKIAVGAYREDGDSTGVNGDQTTAGAFFSGSAYVFQRSGTSWPLEAYLKASNTDDNDFFGWSLALADDKTLIVSAPGEDSSVPGINWDGGDNGASGSGALFAFDLDTEYGIYCQQTKESSVPGCIAALTITGPSLSSDTWNVISIPDGIGPNGSLGLLLYTNGPGIGPSTVALDNPFGRLCLANFKRSAPACVPLMTPGGPYGCGYAFAPFSPSCGGGGLGIQPGDDVNVQCWYRDPNVGIEGANFTNAVFFTAVP